MSVKNRPTKIRRPEDLNPESVEKTFDHYDISLNELEQRIASLEDRLARLESRVHALEHP